MLGRQKEINPYIKVQTAILSCGNASGRKNMRCDAVTTIYHKQLKNDEINKPYPLRFLRLCMGQREVLSVHAFSVLL